MTDVVGKCLREAKSFSGTGSSQANRYLLRSATYEAARKRRDLKSEFNASRAEKGYLLWKEGRKNGCRSFYPIEIDEESGIVRQLNEEVYGMLSDVFPCLHRRALDNEYVPWKFANAAPKKTWAAPTQEEIDMHDSAKSTFGSAVISGKRVGQNEWRKSVAKLWNHKCAVTGCRTQCLLDGAHVHAHRNGTTKERFDEQNGIYLVAHLHRAFDRGLISFSAQGSVLFSSKFDPDDRKALGIPEGASLSFLPERTARYLEAHRADHGFE